MNITNIQELLRSLQIVTAYQPVFTSFNGGVYEAAQTRQAINTFALHFGKLKPVVHGSRNQRLQYILGHQPNPVHDPVKFLRRIATGWAASNTVFIAPLKDSNGALTGFFPMLIHKCALVKEKGAEWIKYSLNGEHIFIIEAYKVGVLTNYQYNHELFGESNDVLQPALDLVKLTTESLKTGITNSAAVRFVALLEMSLNNDDIGIEQKRLSEETEALKAGGTLVIDEKYKDVKQIITRPMMIDTDQQKAIDDNIFRYFGISDPILTNTYTTPQWNAFFDGRIEPVAMELSHVLTNMCFTQREIATGNAVEMSTNRLQYLSAEDKMTLISGLVDRGILTVNQALDILGMPGIGPAGDVRMVRKDYAEFEKLAKLPEKTEKNPQRPPEDDVLDDKDEIDDETNERALRAFFGEGNIARRGTLFS